MHYRSGGMPYHPGGGSYIMHPGFGRSSMGYSSMYNGGGYGGYSGYGGGYGGGGINPTIGRGFGYSSSPMGYY